MLDSEASYNMTHNKNCLSNTREHKYKVYFVDCCFVESKYIRIFIGYINENKVESSIYIHNRISHKGSNNKVPLRYYIRKKLIILNLNYLVIRPFTLFLNDL